ncbi:MAG: NAD(P)/FAD-dependent oxidoreductase [Rhodospirillaceae bacterium]|nr:NAD(P)/FAD-dependent oxidoreductase [Rhodospirillaceae bacterium]
MPEPSRLRATSAPDFDAIVVGAGFAGLYMLHRLRSMRLSVRVLEQGGGVGGTWYWNRYPGARCDLDSVEYSYQFSDALQQEWRWTERFATQPEILRYLEHVADRFDLRRDIRFGATVTEAVFDEAAGCWRIATDDGTRLNASYCIMATGCLSVPNRPAFDGLDRFGGEWYHTGAWPHETVSFAGKRVGVVGTGSSAVQAIPVIAAEAEHLTVFQRQASYSIPARNAPLGDAEYAAIRTRYGEMRRRARETPSGCWWSANLAAAAEMSAEERERELEARWRTGGLCFYGVFKDVLVNAEANDIAADFLRSKIRAQVRDPEVAALLTPRSVVGCKRICLDTGYYATFNRPNVTLVDISDGPIEEITRTGLRTGGKEYRLDTIVFAIGFDAMTGPLLSIDIRGARGQPLKAKWADGPRTYLGLAIEGFPNLFTITGPTSPSVLASMVPAIEQHVEWIADCIAHARAHAHPRIEATRAAEAEWIAHHDEEAGRTLFPACNSWYVGANVDGKPRRVMPYTAGFSAYVEKCDAVVAKDYEGFSLSPT